MTDDERNEINARLARAMGYTIRWIEHYSEQFAQLFKPNGELLSECLFNSEADAWSDSCLPDYTRDAQANRELAIWMSKTPTAIQEEFELLILPAIASDENEHLCLALLYLTAPLEAIAMAADAAIGGNAE